MMNHIVPIGRGPASAFGPREGGRSGLAGSVHQFAITVERNGYIAEHGQRGELSRATRSA